MLQRQSVKSINCLCLLLLLGCIKDLKAQPDCRSIIGAHLTPIGETPLSWAVEGTMAGAVMNDREIANWSLYGGLDYTSNNHQFYFEGAYKDWYNSAQNPDGADPQTGLINYNRPTRYNWGLRELYYKYGNGSEYIKSGVQSIKSDDYFLFDERALGVSASKSFSQIKATFNIGTVSQRLARFQDVCGNRHIYNIVHRSQYNFVSDDPWDSNFAGVFLKWTPSQLKTTTSKKGTSKGDEFESFDEFSSDEFSSGEFNQAAANGKSFKLKEAGLLFYEEFGSEFHDYKYYTGAYAGIALPFEWLIKVEVVDQYIKDDHAVALFAEAEKTMSWDNGSSSNVNFGVLGKIDIDDNAHFYPAFSNLFKGEVMRLDAIDLPLGYFSVKHHFPGKLKFYTQVNAIAQLNDDESKELVLLTGIKLLGHARLTGIFSYITSDALEEDYWMSKLELRVAF